MKKFNRFVVFIGIVCVITSMAFSLGVAATDDEYINVPMPHAFVPALQPDGKPQYVSAESIEKEIRKFSPNLKKFYYNKKIPQFIVPEDGWLKHLLGAYEVFLAQMGIKGEADTWDCENFSSWLNGITTLKVWEAGYLDTKAAIGWLKVDAQKEWAGLPGVMHALMFTVTKGGMFIIEPQNGQYVRLSQYPNRQYIKEVYLF